MHLGVARIVSGIAAVWPVMAGVVPGLYIMIVCSCGVARIVVGVASWSPGVAGIIAGVGMIVTCGVASIVACVAAVLLGLWLAYL